MTTRWTGALAAAAAVLQGHAAPLPAQDAAAVAGEWHGAAEVRVDAGPPLSVRLRVEADGGRLRAFLTLPESRQVALALPSPYSDSAAVTWRDGVLRLELTPDIGFGFIGRLGIPREQERIVLEVRPRGDQLAGRLTVTTLTAPVTLRRGRPAVAYREERVRYENRVDGLVLGASLLLPAGRGPHPVAVFVTGSDPDTRDAWRYEAEALLARGVGALLYDKRGVGESAGASHDLASWENLSTDVEAGIAWLLTRPDVVDTARIGLVGQSQGTWMLAKVGARNPHVRFLANLSGSGMSAAEQETYRTGALMRADGFAEEEIERARAFQRQKFAVARTGLGWAALDSAMQRLRADSVRWFPGYGTGAATRSLAVLRLFGVLQFDYDPVPDLERIRVPTLVIMGGDDLVFPPDEVVARMRRAAERAGNPDFTAVVIPGASHGLMSVQTAGGRPFRRAVDDRFVRTLADWVAARVRPAAARE
ncbi:MAG TPA: alpha/beta hydrolase [Longimicrobium sp.]|nr:alpha/beta hydrolase [Longimicrobium sp.]